MGVARPLAYLPPPPMKGEETPPSWKRWANSSRSSQLGSLTGDNDLRAAAALRCTWARTCETIAQLIVLLFVGEHRRWVGGGGGGVAGASSPPLDCGSSTYFLVPWVAPPPLGLSFHLMSRLFVPERGPAEPSSPAQRFHPWFLAAHGPAFLGWSGERWCCRRKRRSLCSSGGSFGPLFSSPSVL